MILLINNILFTEDQLSNKMLKKIHNIRVKIWLVCQTMWQSVTSLPNHLAICIVFARSGGKNNKIHHSHLWNSFMDYSSLSPSSSASGSQSRKISSLRFGLHDIFLLSILPFFLVSSQTSSSSRNLDRYLFLSMFETSSLVFPLRSSSKEFFLNLAFRMIFWNFRCDSGWRLLNLSEALLLIIVTIDCVVRLRF